MFRFRHIKHIFSGDNESGKSALTASMRRADDVRKGAGLEYQYLEVNPDYRDGKKIFEILLTGNWHVLSLCHLIFFLVFNVFLNFVRAVIFVCF